ncbi:hypothetical protein, partial [Lactococcus petauri]|uniref:hypothetical protein n=1 Tax=Lactococcus petauri TaxID=1940789 RepID=UPI00254BEEA5
YNPYDRVSFQKALEYRNSELGAKNLPQVVTSAVGKPKPLLLVPKELVRKSITYNAGEFNSHLYEEIQNECYARGLVRTIKNGETRQF